MYHFMTRFLEKAHCPVRIDSISEKSQVRPGIQTRLAWTECRRSTTCATTTAPPKLYSSVITGMSATETITSLT